MCCSPHHDIMPTSRPRLCCEDVFHTGGTAEAATCPAAPVSSITLDDKVSSSSARAQSSLPAVHISKRGFERAADAPAVASRSPRDPHLEQFPATFCRIPSAPRLLVTNSLGKVTEFALLQAMKGGKRYSLCS